MGRECRWESRKNVQKCELQGHILDFTSDFADAENLVSGFSFYSSQSHLNGGKHFHLFVLHIHFTPGVSLIPFASFHPPTNSSSI